MNNYYIKPNSQFLKLINDSPILDDDEKYMLSLYQFWINETSTYLIQRIESEDTKVQRFIFVFLANIHMEYFNDLVTNIEVRKFLTENLGNPPWDISVFDEWWEIKIMDLEYNIDDIEGLLSEVDLNAVKLPQNTNIGWLTRLKRKVLEMKNNL